jgi:signal transduction histidine kinase
VGLVYEAVLVFTSWLTPYRLVIPYAVPIFDTPFVLVATGVGYLCLERHRLRQDFQSAALGGSLWLAALLAVAHILTQPDYPGAPSIHPGVAPYLFFGSYLAALTGIGLGTHHADRRLPLSDRLRWVCAGAIPVLSIVIVAAVLGVQPLLPSLVTPPGLLTPFAVWTAGIVNGAVALWALWSWQRRVRTTTAQRAFVNLLALAGFIWVLGLLGFLLFPHRYAITWYLAGVARPCGVGVIFVALLREQVWLYSEARARLRDLEQLHQAGHTLIGSLDAGEIVDTIAAKALMIAQADAALLFRVDARGEVLRVAAAHVPAGLRLDDVTLRVGCVASAFAALERGHVRPSSSDDNAFPEFPPDVAARLRREGLTTMLAVPLLALGGEVVGLLSVLYRARRAFTEADMELLSAFGTQASAALKNAAAFDELALTGTHDAELQGFGRRLLEATAETQIVDEAMNATARVLHADGVVLLLADPTGHMQIAAGLDRQSDIPERETFAEAIAALAEDVLRRRQPVDVPDVTLEQRVAIPGALEKHGVRALIMIPIGVRPQPLGVLAAYDRVPRYFTDEERRVLGSLAHQSALALDKTRLYAELQNNLHRLRETQAQLVQADKLKALGTLLSGVAHELNNPLSTIRLSVQVIKRTAGVDAPLARRLEVIDAACARSARIISDLLVFARRRAPERRRVELTEIIRSTFALQAPQVHLNKIHVVTDLAPTPAIWADPNQIQQVFLNLFSNAIQAMGTVESERVLRVRSVHRGAEVIVEVEDRGPGIAAEHLGRIFDPFFTTKAPGSGTGLGLSLSIGIVESHGGHMKVENVAGGGARFTVCLPIGEGAEAGVRAAPEPPPRTVVSAADVLVVEDEDPLRGLVSDIMRGMGHQVVEAATGQQALSLLEERTYDLVMLDLRLPDVDGQAIWERAIAPHSQLARRVVFMTGDIMSIETQDFLTETGRPCLMKPFTVEQVGRVVSDVLAGAS